MENRYTYFWRAKSPFSNWHYSEFEVDGEKFVNMEQYMMWSKAMIMEDYASAQKIMETTDPKECKALGRKVKPFYANLWNQHKENIVYTGCYAKFNQNPKLKKVLLESEGELVEASPYDKIWGIGLSEVEARKKIIRPLAWTKPSW